MKNLSKKFVRTCTIATVATIVAGATWAEDFKPKEAGDIVVRGRVLGVLPDADGNVQLSNGTPTALKTDEISNSVVPELNFSYFITPNIAVELIAATTNHKVTANPGDVDVGDVWLLPPTLTAQYHPFPKYRFSPYIGAGVNYTFFYGEQAGSNALVKGFDVKDSWGYALQFGADYALTGNWSINFDVKKLFLSPEATTNSLQVKDVQIDPWLVGLGIGYRF